MKDDLISRKAAIEIVEGYNKSHMFLEHQPMLGAASIIIELNDLPSAQPERKTGHWIKTARCGRVYYCDQCRNYLDFDGVNVGRGSANFCPNCGADMKGEQE